MHDSIAFLRNLMFELYVGIIIDIFISQSVNTLDLTDSWDSSHLR